MSKLYRVLVSYEYVALADSGRESEDLVSEHLDCPECGTPAIPASGWCRNSYGPTWTEDDQADCPGCGLALRAFLTGDANGEWMEAREVNDGDPSA